MTQKESAIAAFSPLENERRALAAAGLTMAAYLLGIALEELAEIIRSEGKRRH